MDKSNLLVQYDEDILNLAMDDEKAKKNGTADIIQERISLSVIRIDDVLEVIAKGGTHRHNKSCTGSSGSSNSDLSGKESTTHLSASFSTPETSVVSTTVTTTSIATLTSAPTVTRLTSSSIPMTLTSRPPIPLTSMPKLLIYATFMATFFL